MKLNHFGYSLIELVIGSALVVLVSLATISAMTTIVTHQTKLFQTSSDFVDTEVAERTLILDLRNVDPSFNNIVGVPDDSGKAQNGFFDYYPDVPVKVLADKGRKVVLSLDPKLTTGRTEFYFLAVDGRSTQTPVLIYDPVAAYNVGPAPADFNTAATLSYSGLNRNSWITKQVDFWREKQLIVMDTPAAKRPPNSNPVLVPPRSSSFLGVVSGDTLLIDSGFSGFFNYKAVFDNKTLLNTPDLFFRYLLPVSGAQPIVRMRPVKYLRYYLQVSNMANGQDGIKGANLYRQYYTGGGNYSAPFLMAVNVQSVVFQRDDVTNKTVGFSVNKYEIK